MCCWKVICLLWTHHHLISTHNSTCNLWAWQRSTTFMDQGEKLRPTIPNIGTTCKPTHVGKWRISTSMQRLHCNAFHKDPKNINLMEFFEGLAIGFFVMLKVKLLIHKYVYVNNNHFITTKCECSSLVLVLWTSEFICIPTKSHSMGPVNSLKIQWNHLVYRDTFCCNVWPT